LQPSFYKLKYIYFEKIRLLLSVASMGFMASGGASTKKA
jgi:hypothetical protein